GNDLLTAAADDRADGATPGEDDLLAPVADDRADSAAAGCEFRATTANDGPAGSTAQIDDVDPAAVDRSARRATGEDLQRAAAEHDDATARLAGGNVQLWAAADCRHGNILWLAPLRRHHGCSGFSDLAISAWTDRLALVGRRLPPPHDTFM